MSIVIEIFKDLFSALIPKEDSTEPRHVYRWRQAVFFNAVVQGSAIMVMAIYVLGLVPIILGAGLTPLQQFNQVQSTLTDIRVSQIERTIKEAQTDVCYVQADVNGTQRQLDVANKALMNAITEWQKTKNTTVQPRIPDCRELVITKK